MLRNQIQNILFIEVQIVQAKKKKKPKSIHFSLKNKGFTYKVHIKSNAQNM